MSCLYLQSTFSSIPQRKNRAKLKNFRQNCKIFVLYVYLLALRPSLISLIFLSVSG